MEGVCVCVCLYGEAMELRGAMGARGTARAIV